MEPKITKECIGTLVENKFIKVYDLQYKEGAHYFEATRRYSDNLVAIKSEEEFKSMLPDAVTCVVIINDSDEPKLLMQKEYRYPAGRFLTSPPAGLIDDADKDNADKDNTDKDNADKNNEALFTAARREIFEETGLVLGDGDKMFVINPLLFSTPGMTDESNALVCALLNNHSMSELTQAGAEGSEVIADFELLTEKDARRMIKEGVDDCGHFYSVYTWMSLMYFVSGMWKEA